MPDIAKEKEWEKKCLAAGFNRKFLKEYKKHYTESLIREKESDKKRIEEAKIKAQKCAEMLVSKYNAEKVYLFGSLASGGFDSYSDIDLYIVGFQGKIVNAYIDAEEICSPIEINLVCEEDVFPALKSEVLKKGLLLCSKKTNSI